MSNRRPIRPELTIQTCSDSLLHPGTCCTEGCSARATLAVLDEDFTEHARCESHPGPDRRLVKPLIWDPTWEPPGSHEHRLRRVDNHQAPGIVLPVDATGFVSMSETVALQLLSDAGWEMLS